MNKKMLIPIGRPTALPMTKRFTIPKSISFLIFTIRAAEMTRDNNKLIWMASNGLKNKRRNGVAKMEKPKPVLV